MRLPLPHIPSPPPTLSAQPPLGHRCQANLADCLHKLGRIDDAAKVLEGADEMTVIRRSAGPLASTPASLLAGRTEDHARETLVLVEVNARSPPPHPTHSL